MRSQEEIKAIAEEIAENVHKQQFKETVQNAAKVSGEILKKYGTSSFSNLGMFNMYLTLLHLSDRHKAELISHFTKEGAFEQYRSEVKKRYEDSE